MADPDQDQDQGEEGGEDDDWNEWDGDDGWEWDWRRVGEREGVCKNVRIDVVGFVDAWICNHIFPSSSFSSDGSAPPSSSGSGGGEVTETGTVSRWTSWEKLSSTAGNPTGLVVTVTVTATDTSTHQASGAGSTEAVL